MCPARAGAVLLALAAPVVLLLHGLEGSARRPYACAVYRALARRGVRSVADPEQAEIWVLNSCGFIDAARSDSEETLQSLVNANTDLRVFVLSWDFAMIYLLERELLPAYSFGWQDSERLHFSLDNRHAAAASQLSSAVARAPHARARRTVFRAGT